MKKSPSNKKKAKIWVVENHNFVTHLDQLATEEPLEIRLTLPQQTIAVTMRTPGEDFDLAAGFLYSEGVIKNREDIAKISYCIDREIDGEQQQNIVNVTLNSELNPNLKTLERHFFTTSACGVCGKVSIESLQIKGFSAIPLGLEVSTEIIYSLPDKLNTAQRIFKSTGGLHAVGLFDTQGKLLKLREDVGRHNALDKLIGSEFLAGQLPLNNFIVMVSGRSSFEILQKCITVGVPIVCAVSAPSSLAVEIAKEFNITLVGFLRGRKFNIYSGMERIK
ncbi:MAG: formate dehydrogenase accessory sulfurtransferase FdhD [Trichodesmium sp. St15_bin1_1]|jgi:FdhD protein|nr:formate dehydrogenase accessory sulfurtransferase FdhD [Trichodesmium sp. St18_bin1]MDE5108479.1 formate dehydrogenase accessory sulfurtransferase FdhD [Trichodesmium sp. St17_bin3_1_1]MDE5114177.1 formate dehydrogenase accessory sulfurtransferase FdhD [Trichodesmium sp. St15_bin1_1]MDE5118162.1 formate dehydrogenase accessory sulfurtransferase FdhD [Trichodesmium sp. St2_bin2_1]MDE5122234.1 formate dehydrogenase accessory sulfurtransferase FdhD [Trichodesmium sp. St19_bin1]